MLRLLDWLLSGWRAIAYGAWDGTHLAAQYTALLTDLYVPQWGKSVPVGLSWNMAVHPDYRGRGLIKQVSEPVYAAVLAAGGVAGMGFSNAEGVRVDRKSKGYGYQVVGRLKPALALLTTMRQSSALTLYDSWQPEFSSLQLPAPDDTYHRVVTPELLRLRYACHPFRQYQYGVWIENGEVKGIVVYRPAWLLGMRGATLLGAYGTDLPLVLSHWKHTLSRRGWRFAHVLTTPQSALRRALRQIAPCVDIPYTRSPYYLTVKPMDDTLPVSFTEFSAWDCVGGDIL